MKEKYKKYEERTDNFLTRLIDHPYTLAIVVAVCLMVLAFVVL